MLVCDCEDIYYETIKEAVTKYGDNREAIQNATEAGLACSCCLEEECEKVELPLPLAIKKALLELK
ncbi:MAG: (2Fe-2S)-binding protein [Sulfurimonadaceae bacterium]|jgi:bacterioferritin-associated ferredoxin|nr:(2Fe-2S)-binding protein [Sulfurimonadaceae bacterium]